MRYNAEYIKTALRKTLPGKVSHKKMLPPNRVLKASTQNKNIKYSSVLLLLFEENNELVACLIKRPMHMKHHAGQIALPGGRIENGETAIQTALRETVEEIGVASHQIKILGLLSDFYVEVSNFIIHPVVGWLNKKPFFDINPDEVDKMVLFHLLKYKNNTDKIELETISGKLDVPCIKFENEIIWGATAMILSEFYDVLEKSNITLE